MYTGGLECECRRRKVLCQGEVLRYNEEPRLRGKIAAAELTLMLESAGIERD